MFLLEIFIFRITPASTIGDLKDFTIAPRFLITVIVAVRKVYFCIVRHPVSDYGADRSFKYNCGFNVHAIGITKSFWNNR